MVEIEARKIKELTEEELTELFKQTVKGNYIEVNGVAVHSTNESLKEIEDTVNRIIKKHGDFLLMKKKFTIGTGGIG